MSEAHISRYGIAKAVQVGFIRAALLPQALTLDTNFPDQTHQYYIIDKLAATECMLEIS